jgi:iron(III) transport system permease protein
MPVVAAISSFASFAVMILFVQFRFIDPLLFDARKIFSVSILAGLAEIDVPLLAPGLLVASAFVAALTLGELGATLIVIPPGYETLTIKIYNYLHFGASAEVAGLCLMVAIVTLVTGLCAAGAVLWLRRRSTQVESKPEQRDLLA